ncbi:MAG: hemerythrin domain-containing protein [Salaquimonas sp.]
MNSDLFDYQSPLNHVERRDGLSKALLQSLKDFPPRAGKETYKGEAAFWLQIHQGLLRTSATLPAWCEQFLAEAELDRLELMAPRISSLAGQLVSHAHGHHHIEDDHFFPAFLRIFPELADPIDLLENDHTILSVVLDDIENATIGFKEMHAINNAVPTEKKSRMMQAGEKLLASALRLDKLFIRHISDEEDICLPILMRLEQTG